MKGHQWRIKRAPTAARPFYTSLYRLCGIITTTVLTLLNVGKPTQHRKRTNGLAYRLGDTPALRSHTTTHSRNYCCYLPIYLHHTSHHRVEGKEMKEQHHYVITWDSETGWFVNEDKAQEVFDGVAVDVIPEPFATEEEALKFLDRIQSAMISESLVETGHRLYDEAVKAVAWMNELPLYLPEV